MAGLKRISWFQRQSGWDFAQSWRDKHRAMTQSFLDDGAMTGSGLTTAWANFSSGSAALAAKAAASRINAEAKAKLDAAAKIDISI